MIYDVFAGATKYDMNDSMLTGQNESAERYFKRSLSLLNSCASNLRNGKQDIGVSAYYFSLAFYEVFSYIKSIHSYDDTLEMILNETQRLRLSPPNNIADLSEKTATFIGHFVSKISNTSELSIRKSIQSITNEIEAILSNKESLELLNTRISTILDEVEDLLISQGEALFIRRVEIERKFLISRDQDLSKIIIGQKSLKIIQGYITISNDFEERVRSINNIYFHTTKKTLTSGYRDETEKTISKEQFDVLWPKTVNHRIYKTRYRIPLDKLIAEIDIYEGENEGLKVVEVEFTSEDSANKFKVPAWFGTEVTNEKRYKNQSLAK